MKQVLLKPSNGSAWVGAISGMRPQPVAIEDIAAVSEATIAVADSIRLGTPVAIDGGALPPPRRAGRELTRWIAGYSAASPISVRCRSPSASRGSPWRHAARG